MTASPAYTEKLPQVNQSYDYYMVDILKFICCFLVVTIHIDPFVNHSFALAPMINFYIQNYLCRIAVPFFFMASGFFLFRKLDITNIDTRIVKDYCFKLIRLLGLWSVLLFTGTTIHLWYLSATVVAIALICLLFRLHWKPWHLFLLAFLLYIPGLLGDSYYGLLLPLQKNPLIEIVTDTYFSIFTYTRNGVFMGFLFVLLGAGFSFAKIRIKAPVAAIGFVISMLCLLAEVVLLKRYELSVDYNMYLFLVPAVFFLFAFALQFRRPAAKQVTRIQTLRTVGVLVWMLHLLVEKFVFVGMQGVYKLCSLDLGIYHYAISLGLSFALALLLVKLSAKEKFKWLRLLYS